MTAPIATIGTAPAATAKSPSVPASGKGASPFVALLAGADVTAKGTDGKRMPTTGRPTFGESSAAQSELLIDIAALAAGAQEAFTNVADPAARAVVLAGFAAKLGQRLASFDVAAGGNTLKLLSSALGDPQSLHGVLTEQAEPQAMARAVLNLLGLDPQGMKARVPQTVPQEVLAEASPTKTEGSLAASTAEPGLLQQVKKRVQGSRDAQTDARRMTRLETDNGKVAGSAREGGAGAAAGRADPAWGAVLRSVLEVGEAAASRAPAEARVPLGSEFSLQYRPVAAMPAGPAFSRNLAAQLRGANVSEGVTRIELTPRGLGDVEIDLRHDEAGKLRIVLKAENPAVLNAFRTDREMILSVLRDGGVSVDEGELSFESFGGHQSREQPDRDDWHRMLERDPSTLTEIAPTSWGREATHAPLARGGLDIIT